jgi:hypothetical protein
MNQDFDMYSPISPLDIEKAVDGKKVTRVIVESDAPEGGYWIRTSFTNMDNLLAELFNFSMIYDIVGVQAYDFHACSYLYLTMIKCKGNSSNIDREMMAAISRIEFDKGDTND